MAHYIMAMLGRNDPVSEMLGGEEGRMGDYVFNQEGIWQSRRFMCHFLMLYQRWIKLLHNLWRIRMPIDQFLRLRRSSMV
jgi:hypothetical protein